jgi:hypothetical protein
LSSLHLEVRASADEVPNGEAALALEGPVGGEAAETARDAPPTAEAHDALAVRRDLIGSGVLGGPPWHMRSYGKPSPMKRFDGMLFTGGIWAQVDLMANFMI